MHQQISIQNPKDHPLQKPRCKFKSFIFFYSTGIYRNYRYMLHLKVFQSFSQKWNIIARSTSTTCLRHEYSCLIQIFFTGFQLCYYLSKSDYSRIACIVIHIFQAFFYGMFADSRKHFSSISFCG